MDKKHCPYCRTYRPLEEMTYEWRGRSSRRIKKVICIPCQKGRDRSRSVAERDAYGRRVTEAQKQQQSVVSRLRMEKQKEGKTHD